MSRLARPARGVETTPAEPTTALPPRGEVGWSSVHDERHSAAAETRFRVSGGREGISPMARIENERSTVARTLHRRATSTRSSNRKLELPQGGGSPLPTDVRRKMEPRLGADLGQVRIHHDGPAASAADSVQARAFTVGSDVHFNRGEFAPGSKEGDRLLAHELTHVVQGQGGSVQRKESAAAEAEPDEAQAADELEVSEPGEPDEVEADRVGDEVADDLHDDGGKKKKAEPQSEESPVTAPKPKDRVAPKLIQREPDPKAQPAVDPEVEQVKSTVPQVIAAELKDVRALPEVKAGLDQKDVVAAAPGAGAIPAKGAPAEESKPPEEAADATGMCVDPSPFFAAVHKIENEWVSLGSDATRAAELGKAATTALSAAQCPVPVGGVSVNMGSLGKFDQLSWKMELQQQLLARNAKPSSEEMKELAEVTFHEARHGEQYFRRARLQAEKGFETYGDRDLARSEINMPDGTLPEAVMQAAVDAAASKPLGDKEKSEAEGWENSMTTLMIPYEKVTTAIDAVNKKIERARKLKGWVQSKKVEVPEVMAQLDQILVELTALHAEVHAIYKAFPEEADAHRAGAQAKRGY